MLLNLNEIFEYLKLTCGHPTALDTPSPCCHTLSRIALPPPSPKVGTSFMDAPLSALKNIHFSCKKVYFHKFLRFQIHLASYSDRNGNYVNGKHITIFGSRNLI
jgi:hypothetical protein